MQLFTEKYFPKSLDAFIGNSDIAGSVERWAKLWDEGKRQVPLLLWGPSGTGKTCLAHLIANIHSWSIFEMNASDLRDKEAVEKVAGAAAFNNTFTGKPRLVLLDEVDGLQAVDRGAQSAILSIIRESRNPVILTANEIYSDKKLSQIRLECKTLEFKRINYLSIANMLEEICKQEGIEYDKEALKAIAKNSYGDIRGALLDLQSLSFSGKIDIDDANVLSSREREEKIFEVMKHIFRAKDLSEARSAVSSSEVSEDMLFRWVEENTPRQYSASETMHAFEYLSKADLYNSRIFRRQNYSFKKFYYDFMSAGVALAREERNDGFVPYQFPKLLAFLSRSSARRSIMQSIAAKMKDKSHGSAKQIISEDLPYIRQLFSDKENAVSMSRRYGFDEKEIAFLLGAKEDSKEVKEIFSMAELPVRKSVAIGENIPAKKQKFDAAFEPAQTRLF